MKRRTQKIIASMLVATMVTSTPMSYMVSAAGATGETKDETLDTVYVGLIKDGQREGNFNKDWSFYYVDGAEPKGLKEKDYNDTTWRKLNLPHDYSIEQEYTVKGEAESGFLLGGVGWYRKHVTIPEKYKDKDITINFDGVYMNSEIYVNGEKVAVHNSGYTPFAIDLSDYLVCDGETDNVIAIRVNNPVPTSRWYSGSGIYRNVTLSVTDKVHVGYEGTYVTTPNLETQKDGNTDVAIEVEVENETSQAATATVKNTVMLDGKAVSTPVETQVSLAAGELKKASTTAVVNAPKLWSGDTPTMYQVKTEIIVGGNVVDTYETDFGFRYYKFDKDTGFSLNGTNVKLKGVCMHHDQGALGAVANDRAIERQMEKLKAMGCNSVRVTHNPASKALLEACDKLGLLVIDEAFDGWTQSKNGNYNDFGKYFNKTLGEDNNLEKADANMTWAEFTTKAFVKVAKNSPSIIMWSLGNETQEGAGGDMSHYPQVAQNIIDWIKEVDTTRPVTIGENKLKNPNGNATSKAIAQTIIDNDGVWGLNYPGGRGGAYPGMRAAFPDWTIYGSETASTHKTRGVYSTKGWNNATFEATAYDKYGAGWGDKSGDSWFGNVRYDYVAGEYVWTGFDYIGEPTPKNGVGTGSVTGGTPSPKSSYFGIIDTAGFEKDAYYLYHSMWNDKENTLHILPTWNEEGIVKDANGNVEVEVYTDAARVELFLNGNSVGSKQMYEVTTPAGHKYRTTQADGNGKMFLTFNVPYATGTLTAKAYDAQGNEITDTVGRKSVTTTKPASELDVSADRTSITADGEDLTYITIDIKDEDGNIVNEAKNMLNYTLEGEGKIVGMDNGDPTDLKSFKPDTDKSGSRKAMAGKALVIVQSTNKAGSFTLTASGDGLTPQSVTVNTVKDTTDSEVTLDSYKIKKDVYVKVGQKPTLPSTIEATYSDGTSKTLAVTWDAITTEQLAKPGIIKVSGALEGSAVEASVNVHVIGNVVTVENYSTYTHAEGKLKLPANLMGYYADGSKAEAFPVVWDNVSEEQLAQPGNLVVNGTVTIIDKSFQVRANVRVLERLPETENIASKLFENKPTLSESATTPADNLQSLNDGNYNGSAGNARWTNWNVKGSTKQSYIQYDWNRKYNIGRVDMWIYTDGAVPLPDNIEIFYKASDGTYKLAKTSNITMVSYTDGVTPFGIEVPVLTDSIRVVCTSPALGTAVGLTEVEVYEALPEVITYKTAELSEIKLNNVAIANFDPMIKYYYVKGAAPTQVTAVGKDNASVTILPVNNNTSRIVVTSEDNSTTNVYTVKYGSTDVVIKDGLTEIIAEATEIHADGYTTASYQALTTAKTAAEVVKKNTNATQIQVNDAIKALRIAINGLVKEDAPVVVDKTALQTAINNAKAKVQADYTAESFAVLTAKLAAAEAVNAKTDATQQQVTDATTQLNAAINGLVPVISNVTELPKSGMTATAGNSESNQPASNAIDGNATTNWHTSYSGSDRALHYITLDMGKTYDINAVNALPRNNADDMYGNGVITKYEVQVSMDGTTFTTVSKGAWEKSTGVKKGNIAALIPARYVRLVSVESYTDTPSKNYTSLAEFGIMGKDHTLTVDKTVAVAKALKDVIAKGDYNDTTYNAYTSAREALNAVIAKANASQTEVNTAVTNFDNAVKGLSTEQEPVAPNKDALNAKIVEANKKVEADYTAESWAPFKVALNKANTVKNNNAATQTEVDNALAELTTAMGKLVQKPEPEPEVDKKDLEAAIAKAKAIDKSKYTDATYAILKTAIEEAEKVFKDPSANLKAVEAAILDINEAINNLEEKPVIKKQGWVKEGNNYRYYENDKVVSNKWVQAKNKTWSYADKNGYMAKGWQKIGTTWYYLGTDGIMKTGWQKIDNVWYLLANNGNMLTGWQKVSGTWYLLANSGKMLTGWQKVGGTWYYLASSGKMKTGWLKDAGKWYYLKSNGAMATGWVKDAGKWYYMSNSGVMQTGWVQLKGKWYFLKSNGVMATGWTKVGNKTYNLNVSTGAWNGQVK